MTLLLQERGLFTWSEGAQGLGQAIRAAEMSSDSDDRDGTGYYRHWLAALERLVSQKGIASSEVLADRRAAWDRAAHATPHGAPIRLETIRARPRAPYIRAGEGLDAGRWRTARPCVIP